MGAHGMLLAAVICASAWHPCAGQVPGGLLMERVTSTTDTSQTYALYLPPGYTTDHRWPVLFVLDPRGRALLALRLFEAAASRLGWVVMSSYNTLSDGPAEPNVNAMDAMLTSAQARLSVDPSRFYLAGFSGTARAALRFAVTLRGHVAGVIAAGGALGFELGGPETVFAGDSTFAYFGAAGTRDFNYEEVLAIAAPGCPSEWPCLTGPTAGHRPASAATLSTGSSCARCGEGSARRIRHGSAAGSRTISRGQRSSSGSVTGRRRCA
jgi:poly(3-hydroxybutyrate) depolymerase